MRIMVRGMEEEGVLYRTVVEAKSRLEVEKELSQIPILTAADQEEFEKILVELGFEISYGKGKIQGIVDVFATDHIDNFF